MTTLEIRKLISKVKHIRILLDLRPLRATIRDIIVGKDGDGNEDLTSMSSFFFDEDTGQGYCPGIMTVNTPEGETAHPTVSVTDCPGNAPRVGVLATITK